MKREHQTSPTLIMLSAMLVLCIAGWIVPSTSAQGPPVQVNAADPMSAEQGTINLNVRVTGKGFKNGAQAKWFVTGTTNPGGVTVNSTTFVSSTELTANITVANEAVISDFDIQVLNSDGRGGKGTELFAVTAKGNQVQDIGVVARFVYCAPPGSDSASQATYAACIQQNRLRNDVDRDYVNGQEGVAAVFNIVSGSNDLTINVLSVPTRRTVVDLFDLIPESSNQVLPSWRTTPQSAKTFFNVRQAYLAKSFCSGSYPCDMITVMSSTINVAGDNSTYRLQLFPNSNLPVNSPEITSQVRVHYDVIAGVETWTITPQTNTSSGRTVAGLARQAKKSTDPAGQYLMPFTLTAKRQ